MSGIDVFLQLGKLYFKGGFLGKHSPYVAHDHAEKGYKLLGGELHYRARLAVINPQPDVVPLLVLMDATR